jgi:hypothetical protein
MMGMVESCLKIVPENAAKSAEKKVCLTCTYLDIFPHYVMCLLHGEKITAIEDSGCHAWAPGAIEP